MRLAHQPSSLWDAVAPRSGTFGFYPKDGTAELSWSDAFLVDHGFLGLHDPFQVEHPSCQGVGRPSWVHHAFVEVPRVAL
ncbi:unnamed protein product, partial [Iphiclides podalirius]